MITNSQEKVTANLSASVFCTFISITAAAANILGRIGFSNNEILSTMELLTVSVLLLFFDQSFLFVPQRLLRTATRTAAWSLVTALTCLIVLSYLPHFAALNLIIPTAVFCLARGLWRFFSAENRPKLKWFVPLSVLFACWLVAKQLHPLFFEEIILGKAYLDTLFDTVLTSLIHTYGTITTGYDGIAPFSYHVGSHWFFGRLVQLLDLPAITICSKGQLIIFVPLMIKALLTLSFDFVGLISPEGWKEPFARKPLFWLIVIITYIGVLPFDTAVHMALAWHTSIITDSYSVALTLMFLAISVVITNVQAEAYGDFSKPSVQIVWIGVVPLLLFVTGMTKQSILYCFIVVGAYLYVRLRLFKIAVFNFAVLSTALLTAIAFKLSFSTSASPVHILDFYSTYIKSEFYPFFPVCYYFWTLALATIYALYATSREKAQPHTLFRLQLLVEAIIVLVLASQFPPNIVKIAGGSGIYFLELQQWISLAAVLSLLSSFSTKDAWLRIRVFSGANPLVALFAGLIILFPLTSLLENTYTCFKDFLSDYVATRVDLTYFPNRAPGKKVSYEMTQLANAVEHFRLKRCYAMVKNCRFPTGAQANLNSLPVYQTLKTVSNLNNLSVSFRSSVLLYIPRTEKIYWSLYPCSFQPIITPALTGIASLAGLPPPGCPAKFWGMELYPPRKIDAPGYASDKTLPDTQVLRMANERGFDKVLMYERHGNDCFVVLLKNEDGLIARKRLVVQ